MARQRLGQHFLADPEWREQIARAIRVSRHALAHSASNERKDHCWIEIGAGHGEMTEYMAGTGEPVYAVELDRSLIPHLQQLARKFPNLTVIPADVLELDIAALGAGRDVCIYGNLPYYITSPILHRLFTFSAFIEEIHVVIQTEVAERLIAVPDSKAYGYLSVATQFYARPELVFSIPRGAFRPPPEVGSALVTLHFPGERNKLGKIDELAFLNFVKACFSQKRKTMVNNLRRLAKPERIRESLASLGLRPDARAEQVSVPLLAALHRNILSS